MRKKSSEKSFCQVDTQKQFLYMIFSFITYTHTSSELCNSCLVTKSCLILCDPHGLQPARPLCPWDSPGKNTGLDCYSLLQRIFPTQRPKPSLHWQVDSLPLSHLGSLYTQHTYTGTHSQCVIERQMWIIFFLSPVYLSIHHHVSKMK